MESTAEIDHRPRLRKNSWIWLSLASILFLPVFVDLINGIIIWKFNSSFSIGILYRGILFALALPFLLLIEQKWLTTLALLLFGLFCISFLLWASTECIGPAQDIQVLVKLLYPIVLLAYLFFAESKSRFTADQLINLFMGFCTVAALAIIFSLITGIGLDTYGNDEGVSYTYGTKSLFKGQNDVGITLLIGYTFSLYRLLKSASLWNIFVSILIMSALVALSTRAGVVGAFVVTTAFSVTFFLTPTTDFKLSIPLRMITLLLGIILMSFLIYKFIELLSHYKYLIQKFQSLAEEHPRESLQNAGWIVLEQRPWYHDILGQGAYGFTQDVSELMPGARGFKDNGKTIEVDYMDLFGNYGIVFTVLFYILPLTAYVKSVLKVFADQSLLSFTVLFAFTVLLGHSFLAGHVFFIPMVASPLTLLYFLSFSDLNKNPIEDPPYK